MTNLSPNAFGSTITLLMQLLGVVAIIVTIAKQAIDVFLGLKKLKEEKTIAAAAKATSPSSITHQIRLHMSFFFSRAALAIGCILVLSYQMFGAGASAPPSRSDVAFIALATGFYVVVSLDRPASPVSSAYPTQAAPPGLSGKETP